MFDKLLTLDEFITPVFLRPFYLVAMAVTAFGGIAAMLGGLGMMMVAPLGGFVTVLVSAGSTVVALFGIRLGFEAFLALFRLHARFVGGHPRDRIPD